MLYIGTAEELPLESSDALKVESLEPRARDVRQWFSHPFIRFVGAHTGCSCGFPSVIAETEIEYYEGMPLLSDDRGADLRSVEALIELLARGLAHADRVELYPVAHGDESKAPKGTIEWQLAALDPERVFFNERFMHVVRNAVQIDTHADDRLRTGAVLFVRDLDRAAAFYADVLGLREANRSDDHIVLEAPGYEMVVHRAYGDDPPASGSMSPVPRRSGAAFKPVFFVNDLARARSAVERRGGVMDPIERAWSFNGVMVCDAVDPEGNVIQLRALR